ncbi:putative peptidylprolyl isomerase [Helianthus annuus]|nr:putative peptidylprolyl isomerase [Helianthus annuus]KAJ0936350.1 putative peptidylprolyl isomerase [Helianthus annuus]KAJ0944283.1 putative peptidylprolyl isomerase [Helianthus annuus]
MELCSSAPPKSFYFKSFLISPPISSIIMPYSLKPTNQFTSLKISPTFHQLSHSPRMLSVCLVQAVDDVVKDPLPADLIVKEIQEPNCRIRLSVEVPAVVCEDCYDMVIDEFMKRAAVPGYRPGRQVPEEALVRYIGKDGVNKAAVEAILKRTLPHAMSSVEGRALKDSLRITTTFSEMEKTYTSLDILRYDVVVDVAPEVKWVPEDGYKNLKVVVELDSEIEAKTAAELELKRRYKTLSTMRIVTNRGLQVGDVVVLDISATTVEQDGSQVKDVPAAGSKGFRFDTEDGDTVVPGFLDAIIGIQGGETKSFPLVFPDSWEQEDLRGLSCQFTVECKELFYRELPEMNDAIADKLLPGCTNIKQVKESLLESCIELEKTAKNQATDNVILDQLQKMIQVEIPESLFEEHGMQVYGDKLLQIQSNMKLSEEQIEALSSPKAVKEFLEYERGNIENIIKQSLAVADIFKRENLQFSTDDLVKEVENSIAEFKKHNQEYDEESIQAQVQEILEGAKVLEWLREHANIQYVTN